MTVAYDTNLRDRVGAYPDRFFDAVAGPNATSIESSVFRFAKTQSRTELAIIANTIVTLPDASTTTIEMFWDSDKNGSFSSSKVISVLAPSGSADAYNAGVVMALETPETDVEHYVKVKITSDANLSGAKIDGKIYYTA